ncbi:MAG: hypothetical protein JO345_17245 [Streptosporangiaceae bacterium]|nr:hypothetical protein [Streptosporangiaceae bacterium]
MFGDLRSLPDLSHMSVWLAGEVGQVSLARTADNGSWRAAVDQHAAEVREVLGGRVAVDPLLGYARGFIEACVARGWWPPHRDTRLDWESLRLAAVCRLFLDTQGLGLLSATTRTTQKQSDRTPAKSSQACQYSPV